VRLYLSGRALEFSVDGGASRAWLVEGGGGGAMQGCRVCGMLFWELVVVCR
jgi:hypothetical protein